MAESLHDNSTRGLVVVSGKMGAGKTMFGVRWMLEELGRGRLVYSNIKLHWTACEKYFKARGVKVPRGNYRLLETLSNFHEQLAEDSFVVLDEAQLEYNSRDYSKTDSQQRELLTFIPQARKWGCHIVIITQHEGNVDMQFLRQAAYYYRAKDLWHWPLIKMVLPWPYSLVLKTDTDGKTVLDRFLMRRTSLLGNCYNTKQKFKNFALAGEPAAKVEGHFQAVRYGRFLIVIGLLVMLSGAWMRRKRAAAEAAIVQKAPAVTRPKNVVSMPDGPPAPPPPPPYDPSMDRGAIEQELPAFRRVLGSSSTPGDVSDGAHWRPRIYLESGRELAVGDWLCGRVISWVKTSNNTVLVAVDHPIQTVTLYDRKLFPVERNSGWRGPRRGDVGRDVGLDRLPENHSSGYEGRTLSTTSGPSSPALRLAPNSPAGSRP